MMDTAGRITKWKSPVESFLAGWMPDSKGVVIFRDWKYGLASLDGATSRAGHLEFSKDLPTPERVAYLPVRDTFVWVEQDKSGSFLRTPEGDLSPPRRSWGREMLAASSDGNYVAACDPGPGRPSLHVYDLRAKVWLEPQPIVPHPDSTWSWYESTWNPWIAASSQLVFFSPNGLVVSSPDGKQQRIIAKPSETAALPAASPDGNWIAYATFEKRPVEGHPDRPFWACSGIWVVPFDGSQQPRRIAPRSAETIYGLRWIDNHRVVFDRLNDRPFDRTARLWTVDAGR